ncbi:MAG: Gfo/Idh/MocA family oxidoreductase, partial [Opitutae bacterium]|nr:Gfo/Idh/MocA family oxidoreductase [Opitutae bacterium]
MNRLRGIGLGAGYFSHFQYEAWNRIPEVAIIALCNRSVAKAAPVAEQYGIEKVSPWTDLGNLLDETKPDFIDVITPPETHPEVVQLAASKGINIICQKPLAPTLKESRKILKLAKNAGIRFMLHENWRWQP